MRIYLVDDTPVKHEWFISMMKRTKERFGDGFAPGFGWDVAESRDRAMNARTLWEAVLDKDAAYLVDLELYASGLATDATFQFEAAFEALFRSSTIEEIERAVNAFDSLPVEMTDMRRRFRVAMMVLLSIRELGKSAVLASGQARGTEVDLLVEHHLARKPRDGFPWRAPDTMQRDAFEQKLETWSSEIAALNDPVAALHLKTSQWFSKSIGVFGPTKWDSIQEHGLPHDLPITKEEGDPFDARCTRQSYASAIQELFPGAPETWWVDKARAQALHNSLKSTLGHHAQWVSDTENKRPLSLAGAYVALLVAVKANAPSDLSRCYVEDWTGFVRGKKPLEFLQPMLHADAKRAFSCLVDFFSYVVRAHDDGRFCIETVRPPGPSAQWLGIKLDWPDENLDKFAEEFRQSASSSAETMKIDYSGKTVGAYWKFLIASQAHIEGIGAKASVRVDCGKKSDWRGWIKVSSR